VNVIVSWSCSVKSGESCWRWNRCTGYEARCALSFSLLYRVSDFRRGRKIAKSALLASSCLSVSSVSLSVWNAAPTERIFMKFWYLSIFFFENLLRKFMFHENLTKITGTLHEAIYTFMAVSR